MGAKEVARALRAKIDASGMLQKDYADSIGVSRSTVSHIINWDNPKTKRPAKVSDKKLAEVTRRANLEVDVGEQQKLNLRQKADRATKRHKPKNKAPLDSSVNVAVLDAMVWISSVLLAVLKKLRNGQLKSIEEVEGLIPEAMNDGLKDNVLAMGGKSVLDAKSGKYGSGHEEVMDKVRAIREALKPAARLAKMNRGLKVEPPESKPVKRRGRKPKAPAKRPWKGQVWRCKDKRRAFLVRIFKVTRDGWVHLKPVKGASDSVKWRQRSKIAKAQFVRRYKYVRG